MRRVFMRAVLLGMVLVQGCVALPAGDLVWEEILAPLIVLVVGGVLGAIATIVFKPRLEHWDERRKLRLEERAQAKEKAKEDAQQRQVHDQRLQRYLDRVAQAYNHTRRRANRADAPERYFHRTLYSGSARS